MSNTPTPHIGAKFGDIAETVIMAGDPLRVKLMAEKFLDDAVQFNNVRGMLGYTGTYKGKRVSVMGHGMGMPSIGIYTYELYNFYGVENILRVGTAGGMSPRVKIRDVVLGMGACTNSNFASQYNLPGTYAPTADYTLLSTAAKKAEELGLHVEVGNVLSSDIFYDDDPNANPAWRKLGVLAVEMEAAALYMNAARLGKRALAICTISDHLLTGEATDSETRQVAFRDMMKLALEVAVEMDQRPIESRE